MNFSDPETSRPVQASSETAPAVTVSALQRIEYWGFRLVAGLVRAMPLDTASNVSGWIWRHLAPHLRRHSRTLDHLAAAFPDMPLAERERIARQMWEFLGRTFAEAFHLDEIMDDPTRLEVAVSPEVLKQVSEAKGIVVVSLHMGNWEVSSIGAARIGLEIAGVYQNMKNPLVDAEVVRMRKRFYPMGLYPKGHEAVRKLLRVISAGKGAAVLADTREGRGVNVPFFGQMAPTNPFPAILARGRNVPILAGRITRIGTARFQLHCEMIPVTRTSSQEDDVLTITSAIHACFERWIREYPEQWMWSHRRWG